MAQKLLNAAVVCFQYYTFSTSKIIFLKNLKTNLNHSSVLKESKYFSNHNRFFNS